MTKGKEKGSLLDQHRKDPMSELVLNFLSSIHEDEWIAEADVRNSIAHNIMLMNTKIISESESKLILNELFQILDEILGGSFTVDSSFEDIHPYIEKRVIDKIGIEIGGKIHSGRSRNDQVATDIRMKIREEFFELIEKLSELIDALNTKSLEFGQDILPLYTHVQRGQSGTFGHILQAYSFQFLRIFERILQSYDRINTCPLGACAIGGTSMPIDRHMTADLLGFDGIIFNSIDAISSREFISETLAILSDLAIILSRISEDFIMWNSDDFGFIIIDDQYASVSSAMPQKKNPDTLEIIRGRSGKVIASLIESQFMQKSAPTGYNRDFQESKPPLITGFKTIKASINIMAGVINTVKIRKEKMKLAAENSGVAALDIAEYLVKKYSISFREAHHLIGALSKDLIELGPKEAYKPERISQFSLQFTKKQIPVDEEIRTLIDPAISLNLRTSEGSPSIENIKKGYEMLCSKLKINREKTGIQKEKITNAWKKMDEFRNKIL
jgi:argininosuccinate lyase